MKASPFISSNISFWNQIQNFMINFPISLIRRVHGRITTFETVGVELFVSAVD